MKVIRVLALAGVLAAAVSSTARAEVHVSLANGRVSLNAKDATVRQILTEWAKVGQVKMVNIERVPGGPVTLELKDVPEEQALDLLLRAVAGYFAAPRATVIPNASRFDRVVVMATAAVPRGPVFNSFPQPQVVNPQVSTPKTVPGTVDPNDPQDTAMPSTPGVFPGTVSVPGTIAPPPPPPPGQTNGRR